MLRPPTMTTNFERVDARCIADDNLPWLPLPTPASHVSVKLLWADPARGDVTMLLRAPPGIELPRHRTSGATTIYTVQGRWKYREHDWVAGPGSLVLEPASVRHTPHTLADGTDDAVLFLLIQGDVQLLDADDGVMGLENWQTAVTRYLDYCRAHGIEPHDITPHRSKRP
jgi:hypothetical protein